LFDREYLQGGQIRLNGGRGFGILFLQGLHQLYFSSSQMYLFIYLFTYRQWMNLYLATYDYLKSIIENYFKNIP